MKYGVKDHFVENPADPPCKYLVYTHVLTLASALVVAPEKKLLSAQAVHLSLSVDQKAL